MDSIRINKRCPVKRLTKSLAKCRPWLGLILIKEDKAVLNSPDRIKDPPRVVLNFGKCKRTLANCILNLRRTALNSADLVCKSKIQYLNSPDQGSNLEDHRLIPADLFMIPEISIKISKISNMIRDVHVAICQDQVKKSRD